MVKLNTKYPAESQQNILKRRHFNQNQTNFGETYQETSKTQSSQNSVNNNESEVKKFPYQPQSKNVENQDWVENEDGFNGDQRDILDWFYILIRVSILCSIIIYYSTLTRYCLSVVLGMILYFHNIGLFSQFFQEQDHGRENQQYSCKNVFITFVSSFFISLLPNGQQVI